MMANLLEQIERVYADAVRCFPGDHRNAEEAIFRAAAFFGGTRNWRSRNPTVQAARLLAASRAVEKAVEKRTNVAWWDTGGTGES